MSYEAQWPKHEWRAEKLCGADMRFYYAPNQGTSYCLEDKHATTIKMLPLYEFGRWRGAAMASKPLTAPSSRTRGTLVARESWPGGRSDVAERQKSSSGPYVSLVRCRVRARSARDEAGSLGSSHGER